MQLSNVHFKDHGRHASLSCFASIPQFSGANICVSRARLKLLWQPVAKNRWLRLAEGGSLNPLKNIAPSCSSFTAFNLLECSCEERPSIISFLYGNSSRHTDKSSRNPHLRFPKPFLLWTSMRRGDSMNIVLPSKMPLTPSLRFVFYRPLAHLQHEEESNFPLP